MLLTSNFISIDHFSLWINKRERILWNLFIELNLTYLLNLNKPMRAKNAKIRNDSNNKNVSLNIQYLPESNRCAPLNFTHSNEKQYFCVDFFFFFYFNFFRKRIFKLAQRMYVNGNDSILWIEKSSLKLINNISLNIWLAHSWNVVCVKKKIKEGKILSFYRPSETIQLRIISLILYFF